MQQLFKHNLLQLATSTTGRSKMQTELWFKSCELHGSRRDNCERNEPPPRWAARFACNWLPRLHGVHMIWTNWTLPIRTTRSYFLAISLHVCENRQLSMLIFVDAIHLSLTRLTDQNTCLAFNRCNCYHEGFHVIFFATFRYSYKILTYC